MNLFQNIGGMLKTGWNTLANVLTTAKTGVASFTSSFFPTNQKKVITGAEVSRAPAVSAGYRSVSKGATTTGTEYQSWWQKAYEWGRQRWDNFTGMFMGKPIQDLSKTVVNTLVDVTKQITTAGLNTLPTYFYQKWGLTQRPATGETTQNAPIYPDNPIIYVNPTQTPAPATQQQEGAFANVVDFFKSLFNTQPVGTYSIQYPQSEPIPIYQSVPIATESADNQPTGSNLTSIVLIIIAIIGGYLLLKKGK